MYQNQSILECQFDRHNKSQIIGVCVNKQCQSRRPFCVGCQYQYHNDHLNDLKIFDDLNEWVLQNSQIASNLTGYLNDLIELVKSISKLIEATQHANQQSNFNQMSYTNLENTINNLMNLWNCQANVYHSLQQLLSTSTKSKIKNLCTFQFNQSQSNSNMQTKINTQNIQPKQVIVQQVFQGNQGSFQIQNFDLINEQINNNQIRSNRYANPIAHKNTSFQNQNQQQLDPRISYLPRTNNQMAKQNSVSPNRKDNQNLLEAPFIFNRQNNLARQPIKVSYNFKD